MAGNPSAARRGLSWLLAASVGWTAPGAGFAAPASLGRLIPLTFMTSGVDGVAPPAEIELQNIGGITRVAETQELVIVDNDNDGRATRFSVRSDANGKVTHLEFGLVNDPSSTHSVPVNGSIRSCSARGAQRLDRRRGCGIELEHARGETSATRLHSPVFDPAVGGTLVLVYLRHYAIFGEHQVGEFWMRLARDGDVWNLYLLSGPSRAIGGLFLHRASRGIGSITACLDRTCPAEWSRRPREQNEGLPPVWGNTYWSSSR